MTPQEQQRVLEIAPDTVKRFFSHVAMPVNRSECWIWTGVSTSKGYGRFTQGRGSIMATRMSWQIANNQLFPKDLFCCHSCDNPRCVNPAHLWLGTAAENAQDCSRKGRMHLQKTPKAANKVRASLFGNNHPNSKLTADDIRTIRRLRLEGASLKELAAAFAVDFSNISAICRRSTWRHVT